MIISRSSRLSKYCVLSPAKMMVGFKAVIAAWDKARDGRRGRFARRHGASSWTQRSDATNLLLFLPHTKPPVPHLHLYLINHGRRCAREHRTDGAGADAGQRGGGLGTCAGFISSAFFRVAFCARLTGNALCLGHGEGVLLCFPGASCAPRACRTYHTYCRTPTHTPTPLFPSPLLVYCYHIHLNLN